MAIYSKYKNVFCFLSKFKINSSMKSKLLTLVCIFVGHFIYAQDTKPKAVAWSGQFVVATNGNSLFTNFGGPSIKAEFSKKSSLSLGMLPSLRINLEEKDSNKIVSPILGIGLQFQYKKFILAMPAYYLPGPKNYWTLAGGIGIKL
jgi:hypothetical protein